MPPKLIGRILFTPPDARAIFLHNDLLCNGKCSVTGWSITYCGAQTEKIRVFIPEFLKIPGILLSIPEKGFLISFLSICFYFYLLELSKFRINIYQINFRISTGESFF